jgi:flagellar hook-associated protein 2
VAGTISFGGIGSGIDTESIVSGLISASRAGLSPLKSRAASATAAVSTISDIASLLGTLKSSVEALDTQREVGSYSTTSSSDAIVATANGSALPGQYSIKVNQLATEQRTYSTGFASQSDALAITGDLGIQVGSGSVETVAIEAGDSLADIAEKINGLDARVSAGIIYDGTEYRLQVRGLDTGAANSIAFSSPGATALDLTHTVQQADDAEIELDTLTISSASNQVAGAIPGVTLNLVQTSADPVTVTIAQDPEAMQKKLGDFISAYNAVVEKIHTEAGYGSLKASNPTLAGDSSLRTITRGLGSTVLQHLGGDYGSTLSAIGVRVNDNGTLRLDESTLASVLDADPSRVSDVLAGTDDQGGVMDFMRDLVDGFTNSSTGVLDARKQSLTDRADSLNERIEREESRLDVQAELLRRQFTAMDQAVAANQSTLDYLIRMSVG